MGGINVEVIGRERGREGRHSARHCERSKATEFTSSAEPIQR
jgi:hypothetical protein